MKSSVQKFRKSGTQHGFDVYYKISKNHAILNIFVECKASEKCNTISSNELTHKIEQLNWAGFAEKDIHLFLSPSRAISFDNEQLTIEDDSYPFVIIDWMRKENSVSPVTELFAAYKLYGKDQDILQYADYLLTAVTPAFQTTKTFPEVCASLEKDFKRRIEEHTARTC